MDDSNIMNRDAESLLPEINHDERKLSLPEKDIALSSFTPLFFLLLCQLTQATLGLGWNRGGNMKVLAVAIIAIMQIIHVAITLKTMYSLYFKAPKDAELIAFCRENQGALYFRIVTNGLLLLLLGCLYAFPLIAVISSDKVLSVADKRAFIGLAMICVSIDVLSALYSSTVTQVCSVANLPAWLTNASILCGVDSVASVFDAMAGVHAFVAALLVFVCLTLQLTNVFVEVVLLCIAVLLAFARQLYGSETIVSFCLIYLCYGAYVVRLAGVLRQIIC